MKRYDHFIRFPSNGGIDGGYTIAHEDGCYGVAICAEGDQFSKEIGRKVADYRLKRAKDLRRVKGWQGTSIAAFPFVRQSKVDENDIWIRTNMTTVFDIAIGEIFAETGGCVFIGTCSVSKDVCYG